MKVLVLGKGKTGALVLEVAQERGHEAIAFSSQENQNASALTKERLAGIDMVVDFTTPTAVVENIAACAHAPVNLVVGTTGWADRLDEVRKLTQESGIGFLYGSNF